jgi:hypothetical protein
MRQRGTGGDERGGGGDGGSEGGGEWQTKGIRRRHIGAERDMGSENRLIERRGAALPDVLLVLCRWLLLKDASIAIYSDDP